jgi:uncharacterized protein (DUF1697 family)
VVTHVALLRGINVGGRNKVAMADLRDVLTSLGHEDVATYIQSGNVVFTASETDHAKLAAALEAAIGERTGVRCRVLVLSRADLAQVAADNPYQDEPDLRAVHMVFLPAKPTPEMVASLAEAEAQAAQKGSRDTARYVGQALFLHTPDGFGRSELATLLTRAGRPLSKQSAGTARNAATVRKLLDMCGSNS